MCEQRLLRIETIAEDAEGASLDLAKPDETLRQKDPIPANSSGKSSTEDTDGVNPNRDNLSGPITEAHDIFRAPF
jgi:hypothetical protein